MRPLQHSREAARIYPHVRRGGRDGFVS